MLIRLSLRARTKLIPMVFIGPAAAMMISLILYPLLYSFNIGFTDFFLAKAGPIKWIGWENYRFVFEHYLFWKSVRNTMIFTLFNVSVSYLLGLTFALTLNNAVRGKKVARSLSLLPMMVPPVILGLMFRMMLSRDFGPFPYLLERIGIPSPSWLGDPRWALITVVMVAVWGGIPFYALVLLAGLQGLPLQLYEAAKLDGASSIQLFRHITFPLLKQVSLVVIILGIIGSINVFDMIYSMTSGGPGTATLTLTYFAYALGFDSLRIGRAAAVSNIILAITMVAVVAFLFVTRGEQESEK